MSEIGRAKTADEAFKATLQAILETLKPERALVLYGYDKEDLLEARVAHGLDVDAAGIGVVVDPRQYQLLRQPHPIVDHTAEITFLDGGAEAFVITFG